MPQQKTALSIDQSVFKEMDALARKLKKTRSGLYELAARDFLARRRDQLVSEQLNAAYGSKKGAMDAEDTRFMQALKSYYRKVIEENE